MNPLQALGQGVEEFNSQEFYACHDTFEALWIEAPESEKSFYQGILQVAVGCYHLKNLNWRGAVILLGEGIRKLCDYQPHYYGIDIDRLLDESSQLLSALQRIEPETIEQFVQQRSVVEHRGTNQEETEEIPVCERLPQIVFVEP